jgi:hypothetical protein
MQWNEGHTWTLDVQLPVGAVNFKIVMHDQPNSNVRWELGEDRSVLIPETTTVTGAPVGQVSTPRSRAKATDALRMSRRSGGGTRRGKSTWG